MSWKPIEYVGADVRPSLEYAGKVVVMVTLSDVPPEKWSKVLTNTRLVEDMIHLVICRPGTRIAEITVQADERQVEKGKENIKKRIAVANETYAREVLPALEAEEARKRALADQEVQTLEALRKVAKDL